MGPPPHDGRKGHHYYTRNTSSRRSIVVMTLAVIMHPCGHHTGHRASWRLSCRKGSSHRTRRLYGYVRLWLPFLFGWDAPWAWTASEQDADEKDRPANGHDQPEDVFDT
jgi:hypothetical protein